MNKKIYFAGSIRGGREEPLCISELLTISIGQMRY